MSDVDQLHAMLPERNLDQFLVQLRVLVRAVMLVALK
jgi:hypothetical protein